MAYNNERSGFIVVDIETCPSPDAASLLDPVKPPANYKDPAKIAAYCEEKQQERVATAGLEPDLCEVIAVGWRYPFVATATDVLTRQDGPEDLLLATLFDAIGDRIVVGFNILSFDLPVLMRRAQILGLPDPGFNVDRYRTPHLDLLERLSFRGAITRRSLAFYCRRFGIPCADETKGADIAALVAAGEWPAIATHCQADVEKTAALAARLGWLRSVGLPVSETHA